jgi:Uma2 family endonuclease
MSTPTMPNHLMQRLQPLTVERYDRMVEAGILLSGEPIELIHGLLVTKLKKLPLYCSTMSRIHCQMDRWLGDSWCCFSQRSVALSDSEPEPDFVIVEAPSIQYYHRHPKASEVGLVIEVADSSLLEDRRYKGSLYAAAKIPQFWIVNLPEAKVEVHASPRAGRSPGYRSVAEFRKGDVVPLVLKGDPVAEIAVADWIR